MIKILLITAVSLILAFIVALGSSNKNNGNNKSKKYKFLKKQICPRCKTGKHTYEVDKHSEICPYIGSWTKGKCQFYVPIDNKTKKGFFQK